MRRWLLALLGGVLATGCSSELWVFRPPGATVALDNVTEKRAAFAQAYERYRSGDLEGALPVFERLVSRYPELADYHLYYSGVIAARLGRTDDAEDALNQLLNEYWESVHGPAAKLELAQLRVGDGDDENARLLAQGVLDAPDARTVQGARLLLGEIAERQGDIQGAYARFMQARRDPIGSAAARVAKEHVRTLREQHPELAPHGPDLLAEARLLLAERDYAAAEAAANQLLSEGAGVDPAVAQRVRADALYGAGQITPALTGLWELADQYPKSPAAPAALFRMASILWNRDRDTAALRAFEELRKRYPRNGQVAQALYAIGRIHQTAGRNHDAIASYTALVRSYPRSDVAGDARWRIGWIHYGARNWPAAVATFGQLAGARSDQRDAAQYWQARSLEHAGHVTAARKLFRQIVRRNPTGYYAMWAQQRLGLAPPGLIMARTDRVSAPDPPTLDPAPPMGTFHSSRASELHAAGTDGLARTELAALERQYGSDPTMTRYLLRAYPAVDGHAAALRLARRLGARANLSATEREHLQYPLAFWTLVQHAADDNAFDPLLLVALMRQESFFDPAARSPANAQGLMQLLPATAQRVAHASTPPVEAGDLTDPAVNIPLGTRYLRSLFDRFGGDPIKAIAAYNGGEAAVEKWERRSSGLEDDEFVESITYRETRNYVKRVLANYRTYQQLYRPTVP